MGRMSVKNNILISFSRSAVGSNRGGKKFLLNNVCTSDIVRRKIVQEILSRDGGVSSCLRSLRGHYFTKLGSVTCSITNIDMDMLYGPLGYSENVPTPRALPFYLYNSLVYFYAIPIAVIHYYYYHIRVPMMYLHVQCR